MIKHPNRNMDRKYKKAIHKKKEKMLMAWKPKK